jgi:iduronate 2-sulfatase
MLKALPILFLGLISLTSVAAQQPNVLLICIDDLRPELKCFGADYIHSPNIDKIAAQGRAFNQHYSNALVGPRATHCSQGVTDRPATTHYSSVRKI